MSNDIDVWAEMCRVIYPKAYEQAMKLHSNPDDARQLAAEYGYFYQNGELPTWKRLLVSARKVGNAYDFTHAWQG